MIILEHVTTRTVRERERAHGGVPNRIKAQSTFVVSGFKPQQPAWQASALSIALCPLGDKFESSKDCSQTCQSSFFLSTKEQMQVQSVGAIFLRSVYLCLIVITADSQFPAFQGVDVDGVPEEIMTFYDPILMTVVFFSACEKGKYSGMYYKQLTSKNRFLWDYKNFIN